MEGNTGNWRWRVAQAAEIRWWRRYLRKQEPADYLKRKRVYWQRVLKAAAIDPQEGERVLDAGCGPAGIFIILSGRQVDALDPLLPSYESDLPHFSRQHYPWVRFFAEPLETFSAAGPYDKIFCLNAINHVADLDRSLDVLFGYLLPGSQLILSVDVHNYRLFKYIFKRIPGDILHPHQYDLPEYLAMIRQRGGRVIRQIRLKQGFFFDYFLLVIEKPERE